MDARNARRAARMLSRANNIPIARAFAQTLLFAQEAKHFGTLVCLLGRFELRTLSLSAVQHGALALRGARYELKDGEHRPMVRAERPLVRRSVEARGELAPRAEENAVAPRREAHLAALTFIVPRWVGARKVPEGTERNRWTGGEAVGHG